MINDDISQIYIYIYKEDCLCLSAFTQFSRYRTETLQVGQGRPGTGRGGLKIVGVLPGEGVLYCCKGPGNAGPPS